MTLRIVQPPAVAQGIDLDHSDNPGTASPPSSGNTGPRIPRQPNLNGLRLLKSARDIGLADGEAIGFAKGYRAGWRWGVVCGILPGALMVALALQLGQWS